jgi:aminopeptidase N
MGDKTVQAVYPEYEHGLDELRTTFQIMDVDMRPTTRPIRHSFKANDNFEDGVFLAYYKGKATLGMFEEAVGEDVFREGVVRYLRQYHRGNAEANDLWASINAGAEIDLSRGLASFIDQAGIPLVTVRVLDNGAYEFSQHRLSTDPDVADEQLWMIPIDYSYLTPDGLQDGELLLDSRSEVVDLGTDVGWILPNADSRGYFRWNIPVDMLTNLGRDASQYLNVRERMGMLSNLWALLATDQLDGGDFLAALQGVANDTDSSVLLALLDQLNNVRQTFITPELRDEFADYVADTLRPTLDRIGPDPISGEDPATAELRPQVLLWLADYGHDEAARAVTARYTRQYLGGDIPASDPVSVAMRVEARRGDKALLDQYLEAFAAVDSPGDKQRLLSAIGSFRDPDVVAAVLDFALDDSLTAIETGTVLVRLAGWDDNRPMLLDWLIEHDTELRARLPDGMMSRIPDAMTDCSTELLPRLMEFYGAPERAVSGIESELEDSEAEVLECSALRARELDSVRRYFEEAA